MLESPKKSFRRFAPLLIIILVASAGSYATYRTMAAPIKGFLGVEAACQTDFKKADGLGCSRRLANGYYKLKLKDGSELDTHGPDYSTGDASIVEDHGTDIGVGDPLRQPVCSSDYRQVFVYAYLAGSANNYAASKPAIIEAAKRMDNVLNEESLASGGIGADYKVRCDTASEVYVGSFATNAIDFTSVINSAKAAGFNSDLEKYTMFTDFDNSFCGIANLRRVDTLAANNPNNSGLSYGMISKKCWDTRTPMHENAHNMGAVQPGAPDSTGSGGHCNDGLDVMCYADGGDKSAYNPSVCTDKMYFDCGYDSYFDSRPEDGEWLAGHWNIGANTSWATFNNNFIKFGGGGGTTPPATPAPAPTPPPQGSNGDTNADGRVNAIDLSSLMSHDGEAYPAADFNGDGVVGSADMAILLAKWTW